MNSVGRLLPLSTNMTIGRHSISIVNCVQVFSIRENNGVGNCSVVATTGNPLEDEQKKKHNTHTSMAKTKSGVRFKSNFAQKNTFMNDSASFVLTFFYCSHATGSIVRNMKRWKPFIVGPLQLNTAIRFSKWSNAQCRHPSVADVPMSLVFDLCACAPIAPISKDESKHTNIRNWNFLRRLASIASNVANFRKDWPDPKNRRSWTLGLAGRVRTEAEIISMIWLSLSPINYNFHDGFVRVCVCAQEWPLCWLRLSIRTAYNRRERTANICMGSRARVCVWAIANRVASIFSITDFIRFFFRCAMINVADCVNINKSNWRNRIGMAG